MNPTQGSTAVTLFRQACTDFDFKDKHKIRTLTSVLESTAQVVAQSEPIRCISFLVLHTYLSQIYRRQAGEDLKLWIDMRKLWRDLARTQLSFWDNDDSSDEEEEENNENDSLRAVCTKLAKFTRNLVAGVPENQLRA